MIVSYADADGIVGEHAQQLAKARVQAEEILSLSGSLGRVLAEPVLADRDQPPFPRSTRDGYACRAGDPSPLRIIGTVRAGEAAPAAIGSGEAVEIMTGAPVPEGADCVVMIEHTLREVNTLIVDEARRPAVGEHIVPQGAEAQTGQVIVPAGIRLTPPHIAAAASCGCSVLPVYPRPRVAILATGDELVEVGETPLPHQIRNSNSYSLAAQVEKAGAIAWRLPTAPDARAPLETLLRTGMQADLLLVSGGVSMGKYDLVEDGLLALGAEFFFTGASIQPGRPVVFGRIAGEGRRVYFFGLPGNPVSTMVTFSLFVAPLLAALGGEMFAAPRFVGARLARDVKVKPGLTRFLPAVLRSAVTGASVEAVAWQGSGDLAATSRADCFLVVPADASGMAAGENVTVLLA